MLLNFAFWYFVVNKKYCSKEDQLHFCIEVHVMSCIHFLWWFFCPNHPQDKNFSSFSCFSFIFFFIFFLILIFRLSWIHTRTQAFFYRFVGCAFLFSEVKSVLPIDRYQNATSKAISLHELKKVQLQERYTLVTQDSIGHLKMLCMSVLSLVVALESEWKRYSSSQSDKKTSVPVWIQL